MITEDYVSFEVAKLLKEKGFDESCTHVYNIENGRNLEADFYTCRYVYNSWLDKNEPRLITAPTIQMAMKWLRENYNIHIEVRYFPMPNIYRYVIIHSPTTFENIDSHPQYFNTYEEACETAIRDCLQILI